MTYSKFLIFYFGVSVLVFSLISCYLIFLNHEQLNIALVFTSDGASELLSYMLKSAQDNEQFKDMMRKHNIFEIERRMYYEVVPEFEKLYRDNGTNVNISAKSYIIETPTEFGVILLEDLRPQGYKNANRLEGLDMVHTKSVLKRLAQWHAASAVRVETKGLYPELFLKGLFNESDKETTEYITKSNIPALLESVKTLEGNEDYVASLVESTKNLANVMYRNSKYDPNEFNVLNHGDCWCNNIMFKYDSDGKLVDTLLVDYQMVNYGSPAKDLHYFLISSANYDIKTKYFDYFIRFYHENLVENLKILKYPKKLPTLKEIHIAITKYGICVITTFIIVMGVALLDSKKDANLDAYFGDSDAATRFKNSIYQNPRFRKHIKMILPWMHNRGFLEV